VFGQIKLKAVATGLASFLPVLRNMTCRGTNGTNNPRYCYSVWLRHLLKARASGFEGPFGTVAELGPGDSLGIGLSALLCGSERYIALDAIMHADFAGNVAALRSIAHLFMQRSPVPGEDEFPRINPKLESYDFPGSLFPEAGPLNCIRPERLARIESELADDTVTWDYSAPANHFTVSAWVQTARMHEIPSMVKKMSRMDDPGLPLAVGARNAVPVCPEITLINRQCRHIVGIMLVHRYPVNPNRYPHSRIAQHAAAAAQFGAKHIILPGDARNPGSGFNRV